jgi:hypothetical protein
MTQAEGTGAAGVQDGRQDFAFLVGRWRVANRQLADYFDPSCDEWREFESACESRAILGGLGNCDTYEIPDYPGQSEYRGFALRLFDPEDRVWRIWWASTVGSGHLDTPVVGRFENGRGRFECGDVFQGRTFTMRYEWTDITPTSARWEQSFSFDGGESFRPNWTMLFERVS